MSGNLIILLFWILGWIILSVGHFIYKVYIDKDLEVNKKVHAWHAFWAGITSWIGIIFWIAIFIVFIICAVNDWIEKKLS